MKKVLIALISVLAVLALTSCDSMFEGVVYVPSTPVVTPVAPAQPSTVSPYRVDSVQFGRIKINMTSGLLRALGYHDGDYITIRLENGLEFTMPIYDNRMNLNNGTLGMLLSVFDDHYIEIDQAGALDTAKILGVSVNDPIYFPYL